MELPITNQRASYFEGSDQFSIFVSKGDTSHFDFLVLKNFIKAVNFTHMMPTRYQCDLDLTKAVTLENLAASNKSDMGKEVKKLFEARYNNQNEAKSDKAFTGTQFFFDKLRF